MPSFPLPLSFSTFLSLSCCCCCCLAWLVAFALSADSHKFCFAFHFYFIYKRPPSATHTHTHTDTCLRYPCVHAACHSLLPSLSFLLPPARNSSTRICSLVVPWLCACLCVCVRVKFIFICHILLRFLLPFSPFIVAFLLLFPFVVNFSGLSDELLPFAAPAAAEFIQTSLNTINLRIIIILSP